MGRRHARRRDHRICAENERSRRHFTGTASDLVKENLARAVPVSPVVLEKYAGTYDFRYPESLSTPHHIELRLQDGRLTIAGGPPLIPLSDTRFFSGFGTFDVIRDEWGVVTQLVMRAAEGEIRATRVAGSK